MEGGGGAPEVEVGQLCDASRRDCDWPWRVDMLRLWAWAAKTGAVEETDCTVLEKIVMLFCCCICRRTRRACMHMACLACFMDRGLIALFRLVPSPFDRREVFCLKSLPLCL